MLLRRANRRKIDRVRRASLIDTLNQSFGSLAVVNPHRRPVLGNGITPFALGD